MDYKMVNYKDEYIDGIKTLLSEADSFVRDDILFLISKYPDNGMVMMQEGIPVAVTVHTATRGDNLCCLAIFVDQAKRRNGIGTQLYHQTTAKAKERGIKTMVMDFEHNHQANSNFVASMGMEKQFSSHYMLYHGGHIEEDDAIIYTTYSDDYYDEYQKLESEAFYELRRANDCTPFYMEASDEERKSCAKNASDYYLIMIDNKVVAAGYAGSHEIDHIAVKKDYGRKGFGRALVAHGVNKLLHENASEISLWVLDWNKAALHLYRSMGFRTERLHDFYRKEI